MKAFVIIPAKGDSKRLVGKNKRIIAGKTLLEHSIEYAQKSKLTENIIVSTEDKETKMIAESYGVRVVGSNKDVMVSSDIMAEIDKNTMNENKVRAVNNKRLEGVGIGIQADMYGVGAQNMFATASSISPYMNMTSSLMTGASNVISSLPSSMFMKA